MGDPSPGPEVPPPPTSMTIDVHGIRDEHALHAALKREFAFPAFYGMNWDAFWDSITGLVPVSEHVTFSGWIELATALPDDAAILRKTLDRYRSTYRPGFTVFYLD